MPAAKFTQGSILRHILVMSSTAAIGISALFIVDLLDIFFLSLLGEIELAAAVGYAGTISFFTTSIGIGLSIALGALVSRAIGAKDTERAKRLLLNSAVVTLIVSIVVATCVTLSIPSLVSLLGATGRTAELAADYLYILVPSMPIICLAMALGAALRAVGDAKLSMFSTLSGGAVNAVFDPIFIFALSMGIEGAATASVLARCAVLAMAARGVVVKHKLLGRFHWSHFKMDLLPIFAIAGPAMLTNAATPIGNAVVTRAIADFGDSYVAGWAVIGRIIPVSFGMIFALSGAIGPIVGQNYGALLFNRVRESLRKAMLFCLAYVSCISVILFLLQGYIVQAFDLEGEAAALLEFFCSYIAITFVFSGVLFVANASFNNLGKPKYSTFFNVGKATLGTIPFVYFGGLWWGAYGVLLGQALGSILFGGLGVLAAFRLVERVEAAHQLAKQVPQAELERSNVSAQLRKKPSDEAINDELTETICLNATTPLSSSCAQMAQLSEESDFSQESLIDTQAPPAKDRGEVLKTDGEEL
ncbi:MATE family efflux transporter [Shewanella gelidii]|uniref:MATE family efflux transporter n=1 Tax=Shewanella gelidii TaxID=1642821 RepID=A0A917JTH5_9GAMM|nr:MATE family efflux transporter [Shewanella gelidii]MCL1098665.1 MATE family efflux transporter [Shewanella gelidii]GGI86232.1 MATE family efflux transporter [Shewanella gelidii]